MPPESTLWYSTIPTLTGVFVVLAAVVAKFAPAERRRVLNLCLLFATVIVATLVAGVLAWSGETVLAEYIHRYAIIVSATAIILLSTILFFRVILPRFGYYAPQILQDVLVVLALLVFGLLYLKNAWDMDPTSIFTTSALVTAVVALSLQDTLGNILGGLALQADQSIQVGDFVQIENTAGRVVEIGWRQTSIETNNWETMVVPNSVLVKNRFLVLGRRQGQPVQHRRWVPFFVDNAYSPDLVIEAVQGALRSMDMARVAKQPPPQCFLIELAESPVRYSVSYWLTDLESPNPTDSGIRVQIYLALKRSGIPIAVPGRNVLLTEETSEKRERRHEQEIVQRIVALRTVDIFHGFTADELHTIAERLQPAPYLENDILVRQGASGVRLYMIIEGKADVIVENERNEKAKVAELGPGDYFGEMALMTGEPRLATVVAKTNVLAYRLDKDSFRDLLVSRPDVAEQISVTLAERRSELDETRENLDAATAAAARAATRRDIRARIWQFFGLDDD